MYDLQHHVYPCIGLQIAIKVGVALIGFFGRTDPKFSDDVAHILFYARDEQGKQATR
jgi:hypothetical protein